jgi:hypothetical protein
MSHLEALVLAGDHNPIHSRPRFCSIASHYPCSIQLTILPTINHCSWTCSIAAHDPCSIVAHDPCSIQPTIYSRTATILSSCGQHRNLDSWATNLYSDDSPAHDHCLPTLLMNLPILVATVHEIFAGNTSQHDFKPFREPSRRGHDSHRGKKICNQGSRTPSKTSKMVLNRESLF